jgi:TP901 family phage tail tape measure protein
MEKTVAVRLVARVSQYTAAMASASKATTGLSKSATGLNQLGSQMQTVGANMTRYVSVPLVALGAGAVAMATQFDTAFAQMVGLANVPAEEVDHLKESVLDLAGETAVAPQELADALYFAASAGLDSAEAMDAVTIAAKASAAGMGSTADNVGLIATAMASYGDANIDAARATDILSATIREGRAEPAELAASLGTVLPIAAQLGVSFEEVGGATAYMSNVFGDTQETTVRLNGVLRAMLNPSQQGQKALHDMGTSVQELHAAIAKDGLMGALELLRTHGFAGNEEALGNLFEDSRALQGALVLLNDASGTLDQTMGRVADSSGSLDTAFGAVAGTAGFKMKQAFTDIKVALIQVGDILLPFAAAAATAIGDLVEWFTKLPAPVQQVVVVLGALAAAAGPAVVIAGTLLKNWQALTTAFSAVGVGIGTASIAILGLTAVIGAAVYVWTSMHQHEREVARATQEAGAALSDATREVYNFAIQSEGAVSVIGALARANEALSDTLTGNTEAGNALRQALGAVGLQANDALGVVLTVNDAITGTSGAELSSGYEQLARQLNLTGAEGRAVFAVLNMGRDNQAGRAYFDSVAASVGLTGDQLATMKDRFLAVISAADMFNPDDLADQFLSEAQFANEANVALVEQATAMAAASGQANNSVVIYENFLGLVAALPPEAQAAALGITDMADATTDATGAVSDFNEAGEYTGDVVEVAGGKIRSAADAAKDFGDALSSAMDSLIGPQKNLVDAAENLWDAGEKFRKGIEDTNDSIDISTKKGRENRDLIESWADSVVDMAQAQIEHGDSVADVSNAYQYNREQILDAAEAAGFNRDEVSRLLDEYGAVPELVSTSITSNADAVAKGEVQRLIDKYGGIPTSIYTEVSTAINQGDYRKAIGLLNTIDDPRTVPITPYLTRTNFAINVNPETGTGHIGRLGISVSAAGRYVPGGSNLLTTVGERGSGDEVILPLGDKARMSQLLGMSQVGPRVAAAMAGWAPMHGWGGGGSTVNGGATNITVNMPPGANGDDVVRALRQYQRRNGAVPISTR